MKQNTPTSVNRTMVIVERFLVLLVVFVTIFGLTRLPFVSADNEAESSENHLSELVRLQLENEKNEKALTKLENQAIGYQDAINKIAAQIEVLQAKIEENIVQQKRLAKEIEVTEKELDVQKKLLGLNIRTMYLDNDISTLEMLASSKDLSEFVDKEQYRNSIQMKIQRAMAKIQTLRLELKTKKEAVDMLIKDQKMKKSELNASRQKQNELLAFNYRQQEEFNKETEKNRKRISELIAIQRVANLNPDGGYYFIRFPGEARGFNPNDYPYRDAGFSMQLGSCSTDDEWPDSPDKWGYCTRQCVSYAAWAVEASGRSAPKYWGNAKDWVISAYLNAVPVYRTPKTGDIAISIDGEWGHAMYVERVSGNKFYTTEYNTYLDGKLHTNVERHY